MANVFKIELRNCNNIDLGTIKIHESKLNIKYGINGIGKSTIAKAIKYKIESVDKLNELIPFKLQDQNISPEVIITGDLKTVSIFDEEYLNQFVYKRDELISNSFEILIKSPTYVKTVQEIETILEDTKQVFKKNESLTQTIYDFERLSDSFILTSTNKLSMASSLIKVLKKGNLIENIPVKLQGYTPFLKYENCTHWLDWQMKGKLFLDISNNCPFCASQIQEKKEIIKSVSETYDKKIIEKLVTIIDALNNLGDYFSISAYEKLKEITTKNRGLEEDEINYLTETKIQIDIFLDKLRKLQSISPKDLAESDKIEDQINSLVIKFDYLDRFDSIKSKEIADSLNDSLSKILDNIKILKSNIDKQDNEIKRLIGDHKNNINRFLKNAGYKYEVVFTEEKNDNKLRLKHSDSNSQIIYGNQYLSFGEKNAFALVLFMYDAISKKPDLIILDDPISSFDKNKKYAVMDVLFKKDNSFKGKTVLMLTHDIEPIIDVVKILYNKFNYLTTSHFLCAKNNVIREIEITRNDLLSFSQICKTIIDGSLDNIIKLIYLRKYYELIDDRSNEYEVLSNLIHKRKKEYATDQRKEKLNNNFQELSSEDFEEGITNIKKCIYQFDYDSTLEIIKDNSKIIEIYKNTNDSFVKIALLRILIQDADKNEKPNDVFLKFINEIYHIENDFLFQLNPVKFDIIPQFIVDYCDDYVKSIDDCRRN